VWISKRKINQLSSDIRRIADGQDVNLLDNREGVFSILKNDIYTLANLKREQVEALRREQLTMKDTLADISHQLKTPLTSMLLMSDLLETAPPDKQAEFAANIRTGLTRMDWLVTSLLKMAKLDSGAVEFNRENVSFDKLLEIALEPLRIVLDINNQRMTVTGQALLYCDKGWTAEALTNILKNASEHSPEGGEIIVEAGENPISTWIRVTDSGAGLKREEITTLFRRFEGSRSSRGFGIGLPLAYAIMREQNGDIQAESGGSGAGASFTLKLYK